MVLFSFPSVVRRAFEKHLCEWFNCTLLKSIDDAQPVVVFVEEGNDEVTNDVKRMAQCYGRCGVILSIALVTGTLAKPMRPIKG